MHNKISISLRSVLLCGGFVFASGRCHRFVDFTHMSLERLFPLPSYVCIGEAALKPKTAERSQLCSSSTLGLSTKDSMA